MDPSGPFVFYEILCSSNFLVERHLDIVLAVLKVVGWKCIFNKTCRYLPWEDSQKNLRWLLNKDKDEGDI